jgi:tetratricopeptide (TPR) repeat protein
VQAEFAEFAGWLAQDLGDFKTAEHWMSRALGWAHSTGNRGMVTYVLARKSQLAGDMGDAVSAIDMAEAAQHASEREGRLAAASSTYGAFGHALANNPQGVDRAIKTALHQLNAAQEDPVDKRWAPWLDSAYIEVQAGRCHAQLGHHRKAVDTYQNALDALPPAYRRDRGVYLARQAIAHAGDDDAAQASAVGVQAVGIAFDTGSHRIISELVRVHFALQELPGCAAAEEFSEALRSVLRRVT